MAMPQCWIMLRNAKVYLTLNYDNTPHEMLCLNPKTWSKFTQHNGSEHLRQSKNSSRCGRYLTESQPGSLILTPWKLSTASHSQVFITRDGSGPLYLVKEPS